jgi:WS/DGAT/MGAT family acyltransferase
MTPLSGLDGAFLHLETPATPMHVASLHLFDLPPGDRGDFHDRIKRLMAHRLHLAPIFERKLAPMPLQFANPAWVHDAHVDLDYHVQRVTLPAPGGQAELEDLAAQLHGELLDRSRPLWRLYVIDGLPSGQAGYYIKVHHAVLDGQAGVLLAQALFDVTAKPRVVPQPQRGGARHEDEHPGQAALAAAALKHDAAQYIKFVRHLPDVVRTLGALVMAGAARGAHAAQGAQGTPARAASTAGFGQNFAFGPHTALNVPIGGERGFCGVSLPIAALKQLGAAHDAKINDIVLALASGALRRWLAHHGGIPGKPLVAAMPISLREAGNTEYTAQATMSLVNLHTHLADPLKRLAAIRDAAGAVKAVARRAKGILPTDFPSLGLPWLLHGLATLYGRSGLAGAVPPIANVIVSNVPGPQVPLYAAGARMRTYWPMSIPEHGVALNLTVMSYAGEMGFGFTTARNAVPDARMFGRALMQAYEELVVATQRPLRGARTGKRGAKVAKAPKVAKAAKVARAAKATKTASRAAVSRQPAGKSAGAAAPAAARRPRGTVRTSPPG